MKNLLKPGQVVVESYDYERTHGKKPRGEGQWMFCLVRPGAEGYLDKLVPRDPMAGPSYSDQKKAAQHWAAGHGVPVIHVCD